MTANDNEFKQKNSKTFCCEKCDYNTSKKSNFETHILSKKHKNNELTTNDNEFKQILSKKYQCQKCDKNFNDRAGLWRHKKKCVIVDVVFSHEKMFELTNETIINILKQNSEFQQMLLEQNKTIIELSKLLFWLNLC